MNIKKIFLSRMTRRKSSTPAEPEAGAYEIPPPSAIGQMASDSSRRAESMESGYGLDLELLASDKPPRPDSANGMNAQESGHAPVLESSPAPISDESLDAPKPPRALEVHQEYGLELEVLAAPVSDELPDESEPSHDSEPFEGYGAGFEALAVPGSSESPDEVVASHAPEPLPEDEVDPEVSVEAVSDDLPDAPEPPQEDGESASSMVESAAKASASGPEIPQESEPGAVPVAADQPQEQVDEPSDPPLTKNGFYPLVRDARGNWRPGKGFSRSELEAAGLSSAEAARLHIRVDKRRRNVHPMNVKILEKAKNGG